MSRILRPLIIALALTFALATRGVSVTEIPKTLKPITSIGLTPTVGGYLFASPQGLDPAPLYGLKLSYEHIGSTIVDSIGVEGTFNYLATRSKSDRQKADAMLFRVDALYPITPRSDWVPYLVFGAGGLLLDRNGASDNSPLLNYGIGLKYFLDNFLSVRADLRQIFVYGDIDTVNNYEFSTGLTYYFGKERRKKEPPRKKPTVLPKAVPVIPVEEPEETLVDKLGVTGPAVVGITTAPPEFEPEPFFGPRRTEELPQAPAPAAPAPVPAPPAAEVAPLQPAVSQRFTKVLTIEFDTGKHAIRPGYRQEIAEAALLMKKEPKSTVLIEGHTDNVGRYQPNIELSLRRANSVKNELVKQGVDPRRIAIKGYGFTRPKASNKTAEGRQRNRNATAVIHVIITVPPPPDAGR